MALYSFVYNFWWFRCRHRCSRLHPW